MSVITQKRLFCCLLAALLALCAAPLRLSAAAQGDTAVFSTFEELRGLCAEAAASSGGNLTSEEADLEISEDLEIPAGVSVTFRRFTIPEGVTLTVPQGAELMAYGFTVQGRLVNRGTVFQGDLSGNGEVPAMEIYALIPGHVENKGDMTLTDVYGTRNVSWYGSRYTRIETDLYDVRLKQDAENPEPAASQAPQPSAAPTPEASPKQMLPDGWREKAMEIFEQLEVIVPRLAYLFMLLLVGRVLLAVVTAKREEKAHRHDVPTTPQDHFQRDRSTRIAQLDDWLKSGLIDRKEYNELKKRYKEE